MEQQRVPLDKTPHPVMMKKTVSRMMRMKTEKSSSIEVMETKVINDTTLCGRYPKRILLICVELYLFASYNVILKGDYGLVKFSFY